MHKTGRIDFIMSNDTDFPVQNGDGCIAIKEFTGSSITISCTSRSTLDDAMKGLNEDIINLPKIKDASLPLYEGIVDR